MTAQVNDIIYIDGRRHYLACEPFWAYIDERTGTSPRFISQSTACWRGYVAEWKITGDELYLTRIDGHLADKTRATIDTLFPDSKGKVVAKWFTGELYFPMGRMLEYVHMGYESVFEGELIISVENGKVVGRKMIENDPPDHSLI